MDWPRNSNPLFGTSFELPKSVIDFSTVEIDIHRACALNALWHSRHPVIGWQNVVRTGKHISFAIEFNGIAFGVAIWSGPISSQMTDGKTLELRRMALCSDCPKNTASRMISQMVRLVKSRFPQIKKLISYQDEAVHSGTIYKASGWNAASRQMGGVWKKSAAEKQSRTIKVRWERVI